MKFEEFLVESEITDLLKQLKGTEDYLKAPNGKKSNLPEKQWLMVRTKSFKNWFGYWENDKKNASKILDENGEPLICYHGTGKFGFKEFKPNSSINNLMFFCEERKGAEIFGRSNGGGVYEVFLNIRKPYSKGRTFKSTDEIEVKDKAESKGADGFAVADYSSHSGFAEKNWAIWNPNQIKSINNKGSFSNSSNNINESHSDWKSPFYYHGSDHKFDSFDDKKKVVSNGIWFTDEPNDAEDYGDYVYKVKLDIKNPAFFERYDHDRGTENAIKAAIESGHDALIVTSPEDGDESGYTWPNNYVIFDPKKIDIVSVKEV